MRIFPRQISKSVCFIILRVRSSCALDDIWVTLWHSMAVAERVSILLEIFLVFFHTSSFWLGFKLLVLRVNKVFCRDSFVYLQIAVSGTIHSSETLFLRTFQNLVKHQRWSLYLQTYKTKISTFNDWQSSDYASILNRQKRITSNFYFLFTFQARLSDGSFLLNIIISLDYSVNKNILLTVGV